MQLLIWITETATGDIQELNLKGGQKCTLIRRLKRMFQFVMTFIIITLLSAMLRIYKLVLQTMTFNTFRR